MFGLQREMSRTPTVLKTVNKAMKWLLAVPNDPELKTWSSRKREVQFSKLASSGLVRRATNATNLRPSRSTTVKTDMRQGQQEGGSMPRSPAPLRQFHFAPSPQVVERATRQPSFDTLGYSSQGTFAPVKGGKVHSGQSEAVSEMEWPAQTAASSQSGWPTQSQVGGQ